MQLEQLLGTLRLLCPGGSKAPGPYLRKRPRLSRGGHPCVHWGHLQGAGAWAVLKSRCLASSSLASFLGLQTGPLGIPQVTKTPFPRPPFPRPGEAALGREGSGSGAGLLWQLGGEQGQGVVQELVLLSRLDHAAPAGRSTQALS